MSVNITRKVIRKFSAQSMISIRPRVIISRQPITQNLRNLSSLTDLHIGKLHDAFELYRQKKYVLAIFVSLWKKSRFIRFNGFTLTCIFILHLTNIRKHAQTIARSFDRELRSRFQKQMKDAVDKDKDGLFTIDEISCLLHNIGARDCLSAEQLRRVFDEITATSDNTNSNSIGRERHIPVESLDKILWKERRVEFAITYHYKLSGCTILLGWRFINLKLVRFLFLFDLQFRLFGCLGAFATARHYNKFYTTTTGWQYYLWINYC